MITENGKGGLEKKEIRKFLLYAVDIAMLPRKFLNSSKEGKRNMLIVVLKKADKKADDILKLAEENAKKLQKLANLPNNKVPKWVENDLI